LSIRRSSIVLAGIGVILIVLGVLVRFVVVPVATKLPGSTSLGVTYSGRATVLNSSALQSGDTKNVIAANVPTTVDRRVQVTSIHGDTAIVSDDLAIHAGSQTLPSDHTYALDRTTLEGVTPPPGISVEPSVGALSSTFPIGPEANGSYRFLRFDHPRHRPDFLYRVRHPRRAIGQRVQNRLHRRGEGPRAAETAPAVAAEEADRQPRTAAAGRRAGQDHPGHPRRAA